jgi:hypothetical protein
MVVVDPNQRLRQISERAVNALVANSVLLARSPSSAVDAAGVSSNEKKTKPQKKRKQQATAGAHASSGATSAATTTASLYQPDQRVKAQWKSSTYAACQWFDATVQSQNADGTYHLLYADGDTWEDVPAAKIKGHKTKVPKLSPKVAKVAPPVSKVKTEANGSHGLLGCKQGGGGGSSVTHNETTDIEEERRKKQKHASSDDKKQPKKAQGGTAKKAAGNTAIVIMEGMRVKKRFPGFGLWVGVVGGEIRKDEGGYEIGGSACTVDRWFDVTFSDGDVQPMKESEIRRCLVVED